MSQEESSKRNKKAKNKTFAKPGSLSFLANKKRWLLTTNQIVKAIESEKGQLLKLIEKKPVAPQSEVNGQSVEAQPFEDHLSEQQPVVNQVQRNPVTPPTNEQPEEQAEGVSTKNTSGRTQLPKVHSQKERKLIVLNRLNQPVGPTEDDVTELSGFLGTLARNATLCPFDIFDWRNMDKNYKKDLWDYTKEKYIIPDAAKAWALVTIREAWRSHRSELKKTIMTHMTMMKFECQKKPGHIPECQFREILKYWKSEKFKAEMEEVETQMSANGQSVDAFSVVMGPDHLGRLRLYGTGVTKTILRQIVGNYEPTLNATNDVVQQMEERMQKMEKQMEEQKRTMRQEVIADVIAQLQYVGLIDPNILATLVVPAQRQTTSAEAAEQGDESNTEDLT